MSDDDFIDLSKPAEFRLSVVVGGAIFAQTALGFLWAGAAAERIDQLERRADATSEIVVRTARLEEQVNAIDATLTRIEMKLDREAME